VRLFLVSAAYRCVCVWEMLLPHSKVGILPGDISITFFLRMYIQTLYMAVVLCMQVYVKGLHFAAEKQIISRNLHKCECECVLLFIVNKAQNVTFMFCKTCSSRLVLDV
jgi:hypothetical protein